MTGPGGAAFSPRKVCNDFEATPASGGTATILVGAQGGAATGTYSFRLHLPIDGTGSITAGGAAVTVTNTVPGQNVRLSFSGTAGQRVSVRNTNATFPDGYFVYLHRPNGSLLSYASHGVGSGFFDTVSLDASGTWTLEINPNDDSTGTTSTQLFTVVDQTGSLTVGGATVQANITTPGQNARFTFSGIAGQKITARMTGANFAKGAVMYLYRPNGTTFTYGSGFQSATITGATLDTSGTWSIGLDPAGDSTGPASIEVDPA